MSSTIAPVPDPEEGLDAGGVLFDRRLYEIMPKLEGITADRIKVVFGGSVEVDTRDLEQVSSYRGLLLGEDVAVVIRASVTRIGWSHGPVGSEGDTETFHSATLKVHTYEIEGGTA